MSFEDIKPSPELLDRISAMMSEEVNRKKPPLQLRAAKYAGIAAAVALAAGGTLLALNNAGNDIKTANTASDNASFAPADNTTAALIQAAGDYAEEAAGDEEANLDLFSVNAVAEEATDAADELVDNGAADEAPEAAMYIMAAEPTEEAADAAGGGAADSARMQSYDETDAAAVEAADTPEPVSDEEWADEAPAVAAAAPEPDMKVMDQPDAEDSDGAEAEQLDTVQIMGIAGADAASSYDNGAPWQKYDDSVYLMYYEPFTEAFTNVFYELLPLYPEKSDEILAWEDAMFDETADYWGVYAGIGSSANLYTFIHHFGITPAELAEVSAGRLADEQIEILYKGDPAKVAETFATEYAIVKGDKAYSPYFISIRTVDELAELGITEQDLDEHYRKFFINFPEF